MATKCFACDKPMRSGQYAVADTRDDQLVWVGPDCLRKIKASGENGYQPPMGGPRLWLVSGTPAELTAMIDRGVLRR
jgi:hypothetical protein